MNIVPKSAVELMNSNKNKLNGEIIFIFYWYPANLYVALFC